MESQIKNFLWDVFQQNGNAESKQSFWNHTKYDQPCEIRLQSKHYQNTIHSQLFDFYFVRCLKSSSHWVFKLCSSSGDLQVWTNREVRACRSLLDHEELMAWNFKPFDKSRLLRHTFLLPHSWSTPLHENSHLNNLHSLLSTSSHGIWTHSHVASFYHR